MEVSVLPSSSKVRRVYQMSQSWGLFEIKAVLQVKKNPNVASQQCAQCPRAFTGYVPSLSFCVSLAEWGHGAGDTRASLEFLRFLGPWEENVMAEKSPIHGWNSASPSQAFPTVLDRQWTCPGFQELAEHWNRSGSICNIWIPRLLPAFTLACACVCVLTCMHPCVSRGVLNLILCICYKSEYLRNFEVQLGGVGASPELSFRWEPSSKQ